MYKNVQLFIRSKTGISMSPYLNVLCINSEKRYYTHRKYQLISAIKTDQTWKFVTPVYGDAEK